MRLSITPASDHISHVIEFATKVLLNGRLENVLDEGIQIRFAELQSKEAILARKLASPF